MRRRYDNSIESTNTPTFDSLRYPKDHGLYRCMVIDVKFTDHLKNLTSKDTNPRVLYDVIILGGFKSGQILTNCRVSKPMGSLTGYYERTLRKTTKVLNVDRLQEHDGEIVYVMFNQGDVYFPVIVGYDDAFQKILGLDTPEALAPRKIESFNGVISEIDNKGTQTNKYSGGELDADKNFVPAEVPALTEVIDGVNEVNTRTYKSGLSVKEDGKNDQLQLLAKGSAELNLKVDKVALGAQGIELLQQISDSLNKLIQWANTVGAVHDHIGNLGYPSAPPTQASDYTQLGSDLQTIRGNIDTIKGSL